MRDKRLMTRRLPTHIEQEGMKTTFTSQARRVALPEVEHSAEIEV